jgi:hydroxyacylglutathione hydrolase
MFHRLTLPVTAFEQNCSLVWCDETNEAALIDPGGDIGVLARTLALPIIGPHEGDQFWIDALPQQSQMFGFPQAEAFAPTRWLHDGDEVSIGKQTLKVLHCPGHTPGHVVFFHDGTRHAFVGDVLFNGGIGRTDFPGGNHGDLIRAITQHLLPLGDDITFTPGHGPESTFGEERRFNPFLKR